MKQHHLIIGVVLLLLSVSPHAATAVICAPTGGANGSSSGSASTSSGGCPECVSWVDLTTYLVPTYSGWETAKQTTHQSLPCCPPDSFTRKLLYGPTQFELIKFNDPHSSETYTWDSNFIYLTAENKINGTTSSRVFPAGGGGLGFWWMPRYGCSATYPPLHNRDFNLFTAGYSSQVYYNNCNTCPCQYDHTDPPHTGVYQSWVYFLSSYNFGGTIGSIPAVVLNAVLDDNSSELHYYGLGQGQLRFEAYNAQGQATIIGYETAETPNQPIPDEACFHP